MRGVIFADLGISAESLSPRENNTGVICRWKLLTLSHTCVADRAYYSSQLLNAYRTGTRRRCISAKVSTGMCLKMCSIRAPSASDTSFAVDYRHLQGVSSTWWNICQESIFFPFHSGARRGRMRESQTDGTNWKQLGISFQDCREKTNKALALFLSRLITISSDTTPIHPKLKSSASMLGERNEMCLKCF